MRGDRPATALPSMQMVLFTPHARGSTPGVRLYRTLPEVYPACAGIDPLLRFRFPASARLPRMRGDRPYDNSREFPFPEFTPHARGSTQGAIPGRLRGSVYPACAGIDPYEPSDCREGRSLPRMRGDRPLFVLVAVAEAMFTPHARGSTTQPPSPIFSCFVYPACAGIDPSCPSPKPQLLCLPRMRGDRP